MLVCCIVKCIIFLRRPLKSNLGLLSYRRELSYFGVKVAIIEPGGFKTALSSNDRVSPALKMIFDQASSEVKEIYGENFLSSCE